MPRGKTRHTPNRQQRALRQAQGDVQLGIAVQGLTMAEYARYQELLIEAGNPASTVECGAILERAVAHVRGEARAEHEASKTPEQHRRDLWADEPEEIRPALRGTLE